MNQIYSTRKTKTTDTSVAVSENCKRSKKGLCRKIATAAIALLLVGFVDASVSDASAAQACEIFSTNPVQNSISGYVSLSANQSLNGCSFVNTNSTLSVSGGQVDELEVGRASENSLNASLVVNSGNLTDVYVDYGSNATIQGGTFDSLDNAGVMVINNATRITDMFNEGDLVINNASIGSIWHGADPSFWSGGGSQIQNRMVINGGTIDEIINDYGQIKLTGGRIIDIDNADELVITGGVIDTLFSDGYIEMNGGSIGVSVNANDQDIKAGTIGRLIVLKDDTCVVTPSLCDPASTGVTFYGDTRVLGNITVTEAIDIQQGTTFAAGSQPVVITLGTGSGQQRVIFNNYDNLTLTNISFAGNAGLQKEGNSILTLVRASTHSGDNLVNQGTLKAMVAGALGTGSYEVSSGATLEITGDQAIRGLQGSGNINIISTPTLTVGAGSIVSEIYNSASGINAPTTNLVKEGSSNQVFSGAVVLNNIAVNGGRLEFAGNITAQQVSVNSGNILLTGSNQTIASPITFNGGGLVLGANNNLTANIPSISGAESVLGGNGTLTLVNPEGVTIENGAKLAPGQSIGSLTVNGNVTIASTGIFEVEVDPTNSGIADHLQVNGNYTIGGELRHIAQPNGTTIDFASGQQWVIADVTGTLSGQFVNTSSNLILLKPEVDYSNPGQLALSFSIIQDPFTNLARTANQAAVARTLESMDIGNDIITKSILNQMTSEEGTRQALDALSGEIHASISNQATQLARTQGVGHLNRLSLNTWQIAQGKVQKTTPGSDLWVKIEGSNEQITGSDSSATSKVDSYLLQLGYDTKLNSGLLVGGYLTYGQHEVDVDNRWSEAEYDQWGLSAYVGYDFAEANQNGLRWVSQASLHQLANIETSRRIPFGNYQPIKTSYDGTIWRLDNELAYTLGIDSNLSLEPHAILGFSYLDMDGFDENANTNIFALKGESRSESSSDLTLGLRARYVPTNKVSVFGSLGWQHVLQKPDREYTASFVSGDPMVIGGSVAGRDTAVIDLGIHMIGSPNTDLSLQYQGGFGSKYERHAVTLGMKYRF